MRAVVIRSPGGPEVLELRDLPDPDPPYGHVRVRVHLTGVNRADLLQRAGFYPAPPGVPADIPGLEYVGTVDAVGPGVTRYSGGERVYGIIAGGAYAERLVAHEREVVPAPAGLSDEDAAAVPEAFLTALDALLVRGRLAPGERVLVHAAGSGVGTAGVQIARALGCFVIGTSRTADKLDRCRELGLDEGIVVPGGVFAAEVLARTGGAGVDVVLDLVGGAYVPETLAAAAKKARIVIVGLTAGASAPVPLGVLLQKRLEVIGTVLRSRPIEEKIEAAKLLERTIGPWLSRGIVRPVVDRVFPLSEAVEAHRYVASNVSFGKVLLDARV
ncbi:NAD(P)H-quinone oxidoreductase [Polyangium jinanense]|uniref:NAD(P)H-quinone oxidoreductase n=1 Tax=Polyangium jinanense TaxID=2829994 RepID=A0A9X3XBA5_9BACT|nr:NAD(P)H-quinone oxidoreductase [Polyangium jinanense]MDC3960039.1 NAD(P)H-quinone oxidoreductase [Polyangium jinanense]MDC3986175.1 NAD(P)H-quinone oxidoreductase [Polyangium jinanense]